MIRSHALIADLLTAEQMHELADSGSVEAFTTKISETLYGTVTIDSDGDPSIAFEKEFYVKFIERMTKIVEVTPKKISTFLQAYYFLRFEILNLKRILRGKFSGLPASQIEGYLIPMKPYQVSDYKLLVEAESFENAVELLRGTPYESIEESLEFCERYDALWPMEQALNKFYAKAVQETMQTLPRKDRALVRNILKFEVNVENLLNAIKHRRMRAGEEAIPLEELFPVTFNVKLDQIKSLIEAEDLKEAIQELGQPYDEILSPIYQGDVALIRAQARRHIYAIVRKARSLNDFGFNVIMAYLVFSELEKDDLVGIAWGLTQGVTAEDMTKYLSAT
ncbi:V-type ATP synthase subunit C [subsurface metagenome]